MKNLRFTLLILASLAFLSGCNNDDETPAPGINTGTATISGTVTGDVDQTDTDIEKNDPIEGVKLFFTIDSRELDVTPSDDYTYTDQMITVTTDENGEYSVEVPATENGTNVSVAASEFTYEVRGDFDGDGENEQEHREGNVNIGMNNNFNVVPGEDIYQDYEVTFN